MSLTETGANLGRELGTQYSEIEAQLTRASGISIVSLVESLLSTAHQLRASDIHIDPTPTGVRVRFRIDGALHDICLVPLHVRDEIIARIKILANLRTDEHQAAQDGRFRYIAPHGEQIDIRLSIAPTYHGENAVLRLLINTSDQFTLQTLGFSEEDQQKIVAAIKRPSGMVLATGPTGSGKTTTLYTLIKLLNAPDVSIVTIEDPIEYAVTNVEQIQVNPKVGLTFANGLRSILRQDPNIIMVGEIRDAETAGIAVNTALTGHLLLSTLHTNDAATTLPRLLDMGIDAYLVASTISVAIGQRLVRKICATCKVAGEVTPAIEGGLKHLRLSKSIKKGDIFMHGNGCSACGGSGYSGRVCINEVLVADEDIKEAILDKAPASRVREIAIDNGMTTILEDGIKKARAGETTIEEVLRVVHE
ncbi:MAG TPA: GspE/PulE family protein [Candidatus Paceibacterota bacterium]|nr:GspE/PulE family protein [Candidatus Paceibacterota bacterium]